MGIFGSRWFKQPGFAQLMTSVLLIDYVQYLNWKYHAWPADLMKLLELCSLFDAFMIDEDNIYEMFDFNDCLLIDLKGTIGETELYCTSCMSA